MQEGHDTLEVNIAELYSAYEDFKTAAKKIDGYAGQADEIMSSMNICEDENKEYLLIKKNIGDSAGELTEISAFIARAAEVLEEAASIYFYNEDYISDMSNEALQRNDREKTGNNDIAKFSEFAGRWNLKI